MNRKREFTRWFSVIMATMLLFSYGWTGVGHAQTNSETSDSIPLNKPQVQSKNKISEDLTKQFKKQDQVTFLIKMKGQVDTKKVAANATNKAQKNSLSAAKIELKKRSAVISALRVKSLETQANVKQFLQKQKKAGKVNSFESFYIVNAMAVTGTKEVVKELAKFGEVEKILPNRTRQLITGNHSKAKKSSKKKASKKSKSEAKASDDDNAVEPNVRHIGATQVWKMGIDGTSVVVASLDSGVQWDHPALKRKYRGYDPDDPDIPNNEFNWFDAVDGQDTPYDDNGHGTHTTGTMVGSEADGSNQVGVAPGAQWIAAKAFTSAGKGTDADILAAGEWLLAPKDAQGNPHPEKAPDVINNSWGGGPGLDEWYRPMVQNWRNAGIVPIFSAGNEGPGTGTVGAPSNYPESIAVAATDSNDMLANFSSRGPSPYDGEMKPDLSAPGVNIRSSVPGSGYDGTYNGTSMAAPAVTGTVALLLQVDASLTVDEIETILMDTAKPLTDDDFPDSPNYGYGYGLIQAFEAVSSIVSTGTVEGTVSQEGEDNEPPTYRHDALNLVYAGMDIPLEISAHDNVVIKSVKLQYRSSQNDDWQTIEAELVDGNYQDGVYDAIIPGESVEEPSIEYRWTIVDYGGSDVTTDVYKVDVKAAITTGYSTDFETSPVGWTSNGFNNSWELGKPAFGPDKAFSGDNVYGTNLGGPIALEVSTLEMPPIDLPDGETYLQFKQWYSLSLFSRGYVYISMDQENWTRLGEFGGDSNGWIDGEVRLSKFAGQRVYIKFELASLQDKNDPGWYLDDVKLSDTSLHKDNEPPTYDQQIRSKAYDGVQLPLTIKIQDNYYVDQVELQYHGAEDSDWKTINADLIDGDRSDGTFMATIPGEEVTAPSITYRWRLVDYGGNEVTSDTYEVPVEENGVTIGYSTDFESDPSWISYGNNNSWERGTPTSGPEHAISGDNVYATNLDGDYPEDSDAYLMMPPLNLPDGNAYLQFKHWYQFYDYVNDFGEVLISTDQENWEPIAHISGQGSWQYVEADLSDFAGQTVYVAFHLEGGFGGKLGWYLDDVTLSDTSIFSTNQIPHHQNSHAFQKIKAEQTLKKANSDNKKISKKPKKLNQNTVELSTMNPDKPKNVKTPFASHKASKNNKTEAHVSSLPLNATVSVQETGTSTKTDPRDGSYSLTLPANTYTLVADAYGFYTQTQSVEIPKDNTVKANFTLQPIPEGTITGTITNSSTGEPVSNATVMLMEDPAIAPVKTDENGNYSITAYEGDYTLHISAMKYHSKEVSVTIKGDESTEKNFQLNFEITPPDITSPKDNSYTNDSTITVKGETDKGTKVTIMNNGEKVVTTDATDDGTFSVDVTLEEGENVLTATATTDAGTTEPSDTITVTLDQDKPELTIDSPKDASETDKMVANVEGTVSDEHLDSVTVNGKNVDVDDNGSYSQRVLLDNGENNIKVVAQDKAGNKTEKTVTIFAESTAPEISNLKPTEDQYLNTGESVIISMDTEPGLHPTFRIYMPLANSTSTKSSNIKEIAMMETAPGHYIGLWTATTMKNVKGAGIEVIVKDDYGNISRKEADGELYINVPKPD